MITKPQAAPIQQIQLLTVQQLANAVVAYSGKTGAIRWQLFNSETNGLEQSGAVVRQGRKIMIDAEKYFAWLSSPDNAVKA